MKLVLALMTPEKWKGTRIPALHSPFVIGRNPGCHLRSGSATVDDRHCALLTRNGRVFMKHLAGMNQTLVNGEPVRGERELHDQDCVCVGCLTFAILFQPEAPQTQIERRPLPAAEAKEEEVGNLLLKMDEEEQTSGGLASCAHGAERSMQRSVFADGNSYAGQSTETRRELPDPATAADRLLAKLHAPFGLRIGKRR